MAQKRLDLPVGQGTEALTAGRRGTLQNRGSGEVLVHIGPPGSAAWEAAFLLAPGQSLTVSDIDPSEVVQVLAVAVRGVVSVYEVAA